MKDTKKKEKDLERELLAERQSVPKGISPKIGKAAFAAALVQGIIPQTAVTELFEGLSSIGNYSFLQAVERKAEGVRILNEYAQLETFSQQEVKLLLERLAEGFTQKVNKVESLPEIHELQGDRLLPDSLTKETTYLSMLTPVAFDQEVVGPLEDSNTDLIPALQSAGTGEAL